MYPLGSNQVALGLVVGLDYHDASLDVHELLQRMKLHPLFRGAARGRPAARVGRQDHSRRRVLRASRAPERRRHHAGRRHGGIRGRPSLKGIHYAMQSGIYAARTAFAALKTGDVTGGGALGVRPHGGRQLHRRRHASHPEHAARVQGRVLGGRREGRTDDAHRRPLPRRPDRHGRGRRHAPAGSPAPQPFVARRRRSPSASWMRCSSRETPRATRSPPTCIVGQPTSRPRSPTSTPTCAPRECTSGSATSFGSTRRTASIARPPTCSAPAGHRAKAAAAPSTA